MLPQACGPPAQGRFFRSARSKASKVRGVSHLACGLSFIGAGSRSLAPPLRGSGNRPVLCVAVPPPFSLLPRGFKFSSTRLAKSMGTLPPERALWVRPAAAASRGQSYQ